MDEDIEILSEYANLEKTEIGEMLSSLISMYRNSDYVTQEFAEAIEKEVRFQVKWFKEHVKIVDREIVEKKYIIQELLFDK